LTQTDQGNLQRRGLSGGNNMSATRRVYTKEYRVNAVKLAQDIGRDAAAKELGIPVGTIDNWLAVFVKIVVALNLFT
jgi:transposase